MTAAEKKKLAAEEKAAAALALTGGYVTPTGKYRINGALTSDMKDMTPSLFKVLGHKVKDTGVWLRLAFGQGSDQKVCIVDAGELAFKHDNGHAKIFVEPKVGEDKEGTFLPTLKIGFKKGVMIFE